MNSETGPEKDVTIAVAEESKIGQGYNDARGEIPDKKDIPKHNGQNLNNDPAHHRANENQTETQKSYQEKKS